MGNFSVGELPASNDRTFYGVSLVGWVEVV